MKITVLLRDVRGVAVAFPIVAESAEVARRTIESLFPPKIDGRTLPKSAEARAKMSEARKAFWRRKKAANVGSR